MSLTVGTRLGPYEVLGLLGSGGMGEVYRARDARLGRDVAVKVLPDDVAGDAIALARFEREARAVAALSHPNIFALFDVGETGGVHYAVTELLDGETLRAALRPGAMPVRRALDIARQIAEGLAAAHEKRLVHRDVKPENIFITRDGHAKLLDFGLARRHTRAADSQITNAPTTQAFTEKGAVVGTVAYMSPEQASGLDVDHRSDQFSLGIVLFEMLAGAQPFKGNTIAETLTAIIREDPAPLEQSAPNVPAPVRWVVDRLLAKEPTGRYDSTRDLAHDLAALRLHLSESTTSGKSGAASTAPPPARWRGVARVAATLGVSAVVFGAGVAVNRWFTPGDRSEPIAVSATFERLTAFDGMEMWGTLSPEGKTVAYQKTIGGKSDVYVLRVGGQNPTNLTAAIEGGCGEPAFSRDGRHIAFRAEIGGGGLWVMEATGESARRITSFGHGAAWFPDGLRIAFTTELGAPANVGTMSELWTVEVASGTTRIIPGIRAYNPSVSPRGARIAYWSVRPGGGGQRDIFTINIGSPDAGSPIAVTDDAALDWSPFWSGDGRFLYFASDRGGTMNLWRVGIDEVSGRVRGAPEPVTVPVTYAGPFRDTPDGRRVVFSSFERERTLERVPFDPVTEAVSGEAVTLARFGTQIGQPRVSQRGDLLTFPEMGNRMDLLVVKTDGTGIRSLTDDAYHNWMPSFSPDGKMIVFHSDRSGTYDLWIVNVDGSSLTPFTRSTIGNVKNAIWSPDGKTIAAADMAGHPLLLAYPRSAADPLPAPEPAPGDNLRFLPSSWSPDSKYVAGAAIRPDNSSAGLIVYNVGTRSYSKVTGSGGLPQFFQDGRRIAFRDGDMLRIVDIASGRTAVILKGDTRRTIDSFAIARDGRNIFVSWASAQSDLWLMDLGRQK